MPLNILVLHDVDSFSGTLQNVADYILCFERYAPQHRYMYRRITDPVLSALRRIRFDAIIIDSTALGLCRHRPVEIWYEVKNRWSFIADSKAVKLAFPQDDYHMSDVLDELFDDWSIDFINTVIPDHHAMLYPRSSRRSRIEVVLTGYVDDNRVRDQDSFVLPFEQRQIDLGQRVTFHPHYGGRFSQLKGRLAEAAKQHAIEAGFRVDVSTRDEDRIFGTEWFGFLGNCRFITGTESGVSVWDPDGSVFDRIVAFEAQHGGGSFEAVEQACFPGLDGQCIFSAVSPRLFEAAMMRCCQILIEAPYLGVLNPDEHYIPVKPDLSNVGEAVEQMRDTEGAQRRIAATYAALIETPDFRYSGLVRRVMNHIETALSSRAAEPITATQFQFLAAAHQRQLERRFRHDRLKDAARRAYRGVLYASNQYLDVSRQALVTCPLSIFPKNSVQHGRSAVTKLRRLIFQTLVSLLPPMVIQVSRTLLLRPRVRGSAAANQHQDEPVGLAAVRAERRLASCAGGARQASVRARPAEAITEES